MIQTEHRTLAQSLYWRIAQTGDAEANKD